MKEKEVVPKSVNLPLEFTVSLEKGEDGWFTVECLELLGCISQGRTEEEALENIKEAIEGYIEAIKKEAVLERIEAIRKEAGRISDEIKRAMAPSQYVKKVKVYA